MWFLAVALSLSSWSEAEYRLSSADPEASTCLASCPTKPALASICSPESFASCNLLCPTVKCQFVKYTGSRDFSWMQLGNVFGLFWGLSFVSAFGQLVLAHVFAEWWVIFQESTLGLKLSKLLLSYSSILRYWTRNKSLTSSLTYIGDSLFKTTVFHLGTAAFGSLIIAIFSFIRMVLE